MEPIPNEQLLERMRIENPWWSGTPPQTDQMYRRMRPRAYFEPLADFFLPPLTFYEYLDLQGINVPIELKEGVWTLEEGFIETLNEHFIRYIQIGSYISSNGKSGDPCGYFSRNIQTCVLVLLQHAPKPDGLTYQIVR